MNESRIFLGSFEGGLDGALHKLEYWKSAFVSMLPNMVVAILFLISFFVLSRLLRSFVLRLATRFSHNEVAVHFLGNSIAIGINLLGILCALGIMHLEKTVTSILAGAGIFGLALSFASQDLVANFISGLLITFYKPFEVGNSIRTRDFSGRVVKISLRNTSMDTVDGERVLIPNKDVVQNPIINYSITGEKRVVLSVTSVSQKELGELKQACLEMISQHSGRYLPRIALRTEKLTNEGVTYHLSLWLRIESASTFSPVELGVLQKLQKLFEASEVSVLSTS